MTTDPTEIRQLAQFAENQGAHSKANMLRHYADEIELYEPVVHAVRQAEEQGEYDRQEVSEMIQQADEADDWVEELGEASDGSEADGLAELAPEGERQA